MTATQAGHEEAKITPLLSNGQDQHDDDLVHEFLDDIAIIFAFRRCDTNNEWLGRGMHLATML